MKIDILCTDSNHPVNAWLEAWRDKYRETHDIAIFHCIERLRGGEVLFLVSCTDIVDKAVRDRYRHVLILHASDLPQGRGWSPHIWAILEGAQEITVSLLEAEDLVDSGDIWEKMSFAVPKHALHDEINAALFNTELALMERGLEMIAAGRRPVPQGREGKSHWPRRRPEDSEIDPSQSLAEQFDLLRVADPRRYPAFFRLHGYIYTIEIRKLRKVE